MAIDTVVQQFRNRGTTVQWVGMNETSLELLNQLAIHDKSETKLDIHLAEVALRRNFY